MAICHATCDRGPCHDWAVRPLHDTALIPISFIGVARLSYQFKAVGIGRDVGRNSAVGVPVGIARNFYGVCLRFSILMIIKVVAGC